MQLAIDALDRLVALLEEQDGRVRATEAAVHLLAVRRPPEGLARLLLTPLVDADARLRWRGPFIALRSAPDPELEAARFVVFDLETTGLSQPQARICEIGAVRIERLVLGDSFETLVAPGTRVPRAASSLTGLSDDALRDAPDVDVAVRQLAAFAGDAVLVAHNARFDVGFLNRELARLCGGSLAATVIDTLPLARNLLSGRAERTSLAALALFFGVSAQPCHRALPDAQATAEVFLRLVEIARERGAASVADLEELAAPRPRRIHAKRRLIRDAPPAPGVYLFLDDEGTVLYVGKARNLRSRLQSYFHTPRQRAAVESALDRLERIEWRMTGSELAAALEEIRLIRRLRPAANARSPRPERYVYLHRRPGGRVVLSRMPSAYGPIRRTLEARAATRALRGCTEPEFDALLDDAPLLRLRHRLAELSLAGHDLELRRLRRELASLERVIGELRELARLRQLATCIVAPALDPGALEAFVVAGGRLSVHSLRAARPLADELAQMLGSVAVATAGPAPTIDADRVDELIVVASFLARPTEELRVVELLPTTPRSAGLPRAAGDAATR